MASAERSRQVAQAAQPDFLAANEWLAITGTDCPAPIARPIAQVVQKRRRRGRAALDELRMVARDGFHLRVDMGRDVHDEGWPNVQAEMYAEVVENALGIVRRAGQVGLGELGPEAGGID